MAGLAVAGEKRSSPGGENWGAEVTRRAASPKPGTSSDGKARAGLGECGDRDGDEDDSGSGLPRSVFGAALARASVGIAGITSVGAGTTSEAKISSCTKHGPQHSFRYQKFIGGGRSEGGRRGAAPTEHSRVKV